jgi:hypothetical protein
MRDPLTYASSFPVDHPYLNDVWLPLAGGAAKTVLHRLACMASDQRTAYIDDDVAMSPGFDLDVERFIFEMGLRPGRDGDGELLPILRRFAAWRIVGFLVNYPVLTLLAPVRIPLAPGRVVAEHSPALFEIHRRYCLERNATP